MRVTAVVAGLLLCLGSARASNAQSLGQVSREEAERRRAITAPARVLTATDLASERRLTIVGMPADLAVDSAIAPVAARRVALTPATYQAGAVPRIPVRAVSGGEVLLEVTVDKEGRVIDVKILRDTPPFTQEIIAAISGWRFQPAEDAAAPAPGEPLDRTTRRAIDSKVLVVGMFRPPALFPTTLGQPPTDLASPSDAIPAPLAFPAMPLYPPQALFDGVVLAELRVGVEGSVANARVVRSAPGLDAPTLEVLRGLRFRPARIYGLAAPAMVYAVAAFRQPVTP